MNSMTRAAELAALGLGRTAPNPPVGAVVVKDGVVVGEGYHAVVGGPHAEVVALRSAGVAAEGSTLFVTLEPCCHHGRTPPCTDAILAAGVADVRYAISDPDPRVYGGGHRLLEAAGVRVSHVADEEASEVARGYLSRLHTGRPWVTVKVAMSLDGKIATRSGESRWISSPPSRERVHALRDRADAVLVGIGTVIADNPLLTVRPSPADGRQPLRVVLDSELRLPLDSALAAPAGAAPTLVAYSADRVAAHPQGGVRRTMLEERGVDLLALPEDDAGRVDLGELMRSLGQRGLNEVLVEGGGELIAGFVSAGLVDELLACIAPVLIGGQAAPGPIGGRGVDRLELAPRFALSGVERIAGDVWLAARAVEPARPQVSEDA
jgi:diaminohydroxyphosphoribosylaminopyrimidine deaminase / 5-amino-6-(5-phosphoribosylamino)uracil reductase